MDGRFWQDYVFKKRRLRREAIIIPYRYATHLQLKNGNILFFLDTTEEPRPLTRRWNAQDIHQWWSYVDTVVEFNVNSARFGEIKKGNYKTLQPLYNTKSTSFPPVELADGRLAHVFIQASTIIVVMWKGIFLNAFSLPIQLGRGLYIWKPGHLKAQGNILSLDLNFKIGTATRWIIDCDLKHIREDVASPHAHSAYDSAYNGEWTQVGDRYIHKDVSLLKKDLSQRKGVSDPPSWGLLLPRQSHREWRALGKALDVCMVEKRLVFITPTEVRILEPVLY